MNLTKLFEAQQVLDDRIMQKRPELQNQSNLEWKILALQVEIGELANEWRGFKKWSDNQQARTHATRTVNDGYKLIVVPYNPLLEEYVDCLHFILSIGNELMDSRVVSRKELDFEIKEKLDSDSTQDTFLHLFFALNDLMRDISPELQYRWLIHNFEAVGSALGFTTEEVINAYFEKNAINHQRQESGY